MMHSRLQSTIGKCNAKKPGMTDFVGRAKWTAWNDLGMRSFLIETRVCSNNLQPSISVINFADIFNFPGGISQDEAKQKYIDLVNSLVKSAEPTESTSVPQVS